MNIIDRYRQPPPPPPHLKLASAAPGQDPLAGHHILKLDSPSCAISMGAGYNTNGPKGRVQENVWHTLRGCLTRHQIKRILHIYFQHYKVFFQPMLFDTRSKTMHNLFCSHRTCHPKLVWLKKFRGLIDLTNAHKHFPVRRRRASPTAMGRISSEEPCLDLTKAVRLPPARKDAIMGGALPAARMLTTPFKD